MNKNIYNKKSVWAANNQINNAKDALEQNKLTEEQIDALMEIASIRHKLHCFTIDQIYNSESSQHEEFIKQIESEAYDSIAMIAEENNLPAFTTSIDSADIPSDFDYYYVDNEGYSSLSDYLENTDYLKTLSKIKETFNKEIEDYLADIDKKYGTSFCPSGHTRIY